MLHALWHQDHLIQRSCDQSSSTFSEVPEINSSEGKIAKIFDPANGRAHCNTRGKTAYRTYYNRTSRCTRAIEQGKYVLSDI